MRFETVAGLVIASAFSLVLTVSGCDEKSTNSAKDAANSAAASAKDATAAMTDRASQAIAAARDKAVESFGPQIDQARSMLDSFKGKIASASVDQKPALESVWGGLDTQFTSVTDLLNQLKNAGSDNWRDISAKLGNALTKLTGQLNDAKSQFGM